MKYFDVRFTGGGTIGDWPVEPPPLKALEPPRRLCIPLCAREPCEVVTPKPAGTILAAGEPVADAIPSGAHAAIAPLRGTIGSPCHVTLLNRRQVAAVEFFPDPHSPPPPPSGHKLDEPADLADFIDCLRTAGIWADRGGCPNLMAQLQQAIRRPIDTVLCSTLDGDLTLHLNGLLAVRYGAEMAEAVAVLGRLTKAKRTCVVADDSAPRRWLVPIRRRARKARVKFMTTENHYPVADPTLLLHTLFRRRLRPGRLPTEQGVLLMDAVAAVEIGQFLATQRKKTQTPLAIFDHARQEAHFVLAWLGSAIGDVLRQLSIAPEHLTIRTGHLLRDVRVAEDAVVGGTQTKIHATPRQPTPIPDPCIRCAWCKEGCPVRIEPAGIMEAAQRNDLAMAERFGLDICIECGICSFVCPSRLPLLEGIRRLRAS